MRLIIKFSILFFSSCFYLGFFKIWAADIHVYQGESIQNAADRANPGDNIIVHQGVYHEEVIMKRSGEADRYITFKAADGETVWIDGSVPLREWRACESAEECGNNPNWRQIFVAALPDGVTTGSANLYEGDRLLQVSQDPDPSDPLYFKLPTGWRVVTSANISSTHITDSSYFTQTDPNYWDGAYVLINAGNNNFYAKSINSFDPQTHTITFGHTTDYRRQSDRYAVWNHPALIDNPGEYYVDEANNRVFLWPHSPEGLNSVTVSTLRSAFFINSKSYIVIDGFKMRKQTSNIDEHHMGCGVRSHSYHRASNVILRNNEITQLGFFGTRGIYFGGISNGVIDNNHIHDIPIRAILVTGSQGAGYVTGNTVSNNLLNRVGGTGISFFWTSHSSMINNLNLDSTGQHSNGLTVYLNSHDILIHGNTIINCNFALTLQDVWNITVTNNVFRIGPKEGSTAVLATWGGRQENILIDQNTVIDSLGHSAISIPNTARNVIIRNNIVDGIVLPSDSNAEFTLRNNLYLGLTWNMNETQMGEGGILERNVNNVFTSYSNNDLRPLVGSIACSMSTTGGFVGALDPNGQRTGSADQWLPIDVTDINTEPWAESGDLIKDISYLSLFNNMIKSGGNQTATISCTLNKPANLKLVIFDSKGKEIISLFDAPKEAGVHRFTWSGVDGSGRKIGSGVYVVHMNANGYKQTKKIVVVR